MQGIRKSFLLFLALLFGAGSFEARAERRSLHFAANGNFDAGGGYDPSRAGFDLADVSSPTQLDLLPPNVKALVWIGECRGATKDFIQSVKAFAGHPKLWGYHLVDDAYARTCAAPSLKAEADWIHRNVAGVKVFVSLANSGSFKAPSYDGYNEETTGADFLGVAAYPCRSELNRGAGGCDYDAIDRVVRAALAARVSLEAIVPTFQAFGGGEWRDDGGGRYLVPSAEQELEILARWRLLIPDPALDYAYSWGSQRGDAALANTATLAAIFAQRNRVAREPTIPAARGIGQ